MKLIKAFFGDWYLVTDEYADMFAHHMAYRSPCLKEEQIREKHTKECTTMTLSKESIKHQWMFLAGASLYTYAEKHYGFSFTDTLDQMREEIVNGK